MSQDSKTHSERGRQVGGGGGGAQHWPQAAWRTPPALWACLSLWSCCAAQGQPRPGQTRRPVGQTEPQGLLDFHCQRLGDCHPLGEQSF